MRGQTPHFEEAQELAQALRGLSLPDDTVCPLPLCTAGDMPLQQLILLLGMRLYGQSCGMYSLI